MPKPENVLTSEERAAIGADIRPVARFRQPKDEPGPAQAALKLALRYDSPPCESIDPELWYPPEGSHYSPTTRAACMICPLQIECRDAARENNEIFGMWGGESPQERKNFNQRK